MTDTSRESVERLCVRLCHPEAAFRPSISDARDAAATLRALLAERDALQAKLADARKALELLVALDDDYSPFGGELLQDRVERAWDTARTALNKIGEQDDK